jgi:hypothetical protein
MWLNTTKFIFTSHAAQRFSKRIKFGNPNELVQECSPKSYFNQMPRKTKWYYAKSIYLKHPERDILFVAKCDKATEFVIVTVLRTSKFIKRLKRLNKHLKV